MEAGNEMHEAERSQSEPQCFACRFVIFSICRNESRKVFEYDTS